MKNKRNQPSHCSRSSEDPIQSCHDDCLNSPYTFFHDCFSFPYSWFGTYFSNLSDSFAPPYFGDTVSVELLNKSSPLLL